MLFYAGSLQRSLQVSLIHKGGFRERANRNHRYKDSENQQASLKNPKKYQPKAQDQQLPVTETAAAPLTDLIASSNTEESKDI